MHEKIYANSRGVSVNTMTCGKLPEMKRQLIGKMIS
jgi:hypothetical protein